MTKQETIIELANKTIVYAEKGKIADANVLIKKMVIELKQNPFILWDCIELIDISKALLIAYHSDTFDSEDDNILLTHLAFFYITRCEHIAYKMSEDAEDELLFNVLKHKVLILKTCDDTFAHSVANFYTPKNVEITDTIKSDVYRLANASILLMQYDNLMKINNTYNGFNNDDVLQDICNYIEHSRENFSEKLMNEAARIDQLLFAFIKTNLEQNNFLF